MTLEAYRSTAPKFLVTGLFLLASGAILYFGLHFLPGIAVTGAGATFFAISLIAWPAGMVLSQGPDPKRKDEAAFSPTVSLLLLGLSILAVVGLFVLFTLTPSSSDTPKASFSFSGQSPNSLTFQEVSQTRGWDWTTCTIRDGGGALHIFTVNGLFPSPSPKSQEGDTLIVSGLENKVTYQFSLVCDGLSVSRFAGTTQ